MIYRYNWDEISFLRENCFVCVCLLVLLVRVMNRGLNVWDVATLDGGPVVILRVVAVLAVLLTKSRRNIFTSFPNLLFLQKHAMLSAKGPILMNNLLINMSLQ